MILSAISSVGVNVFVKGRRLLVLPRFSVAEEVKGLETLSESKSKPFLSGT